MKYFKKLSPDGDGGGSSGEEEKIDFKKLQNEMVQTNKEMAEQLYSNVTSMVKGMLDANNKGREDAEEELENTRGRSSEYDDFADELAALGVKDDEQAEALLSLVDKKLAKKAPQFEKKILSTVSSTQEFKANKQSSEADVYAKFPDLLNTSSALFKESQRVYNNLSKGVRDSAEGTALAVTQAAANLGIKALTRSEIYARDPMPTGGGGSNNKKKLSEINENQNNLASYFGIKKDLFASKLKAIQEKHSLLSDS